jgi:DNA replication and repair protein RecF
MLKRRTGKNEQRNIMLEAFNQQLAGSGSRLIAIRRKFVSSLSTLFERVYRRIWDGEASVSLTYRSTVPIFEEMQTEVTDDTLSNYIRLLDERTEKDLNTGFTTVGPHRDDCLFDISGKNMRYYASRGQQRIAALSLRIAFGAMVKKCTSQTPIYVFDDPFGVLDEKRMINFEGILRKLDQRIITHSSEHVERWASRRCSVFSVTDGAVNPV